MTLPLRLQSAALGQIQQMEAADFALFRYNLRRRYAISLAGDGVGAILIDGGTRFGGATNTERTQGSSTHPSRFVGASTGTTNRRVYNYGHNLASIPADPTNFDNSYAMFDNDGIGQDSNIDRIVDLIITPCIREMKTDDGGITGDGVGTYKIQVSDPGSEWVSRGVFFRDSVYANAPGISTTLWLKTSAAHNHPATLAPFRVVPEGLQQHNILPGFPFETFMFSLLVSRLNTAGTNRLTYSMGTTQAGSPRGNVIDTQLDSTSIPLEQRININDYRTTVTPTGNPVRFETYFLGMA